MRRNKQEHHQDTGPQAELPIKKERNLACHPVKHWSASLRSFWMSHSQRGKRILLLLFNTRSHRG
jgi:hypothetical protein